MTRWDAHASSLHHAAGTATGQKVYEEVEELEMPDAFVTNECDIEGIPMGDIDPVDPSHENAVSIVTFEPGR